MRIVIDTNMIFSLLLGKNARMRDTFFDPAYTFFAPNYIVGELFEKLQLNAPFWTGDRRLKESLKQKGFLLFFEMKQQIA